MATEYQPADEVKQIAEIFIQNEHSHLQTIRIEYVFVTPVPKSKNKDIWGRARKISGLTAWLATNDQQRYPEPDPFFVIEIAQDIWRVITDEQKAALVDHELSHCGWDGEKDSIVTVAHDVEEFVGIVERHGLWRRDIQSLVEAAREKENAPLLAEQMETAAAN